MLSLITIPPKNQDEKDFKFPLPRTGASITTLSNKMYLWGGHTQFLLEAGEDECCPIDEVLPNSDENLIEVYNILSRQWECYSTTGDIPHVGDGATMVGLEDNLYLFGGFNDGVYNGELYNFDTLSNTWSRVMVSDGATKPSPRYRLDSVMYNEQMWIFGGVGPLIQSLQTGAQYISTQRYNRDLKYGWNNEMFVFDINKGFWADVKLRSPQKRPPPCASFTFNMVSTHEAVLFGGNQEGGNMADVYLFDFIEMAWSQPYRPVGPDLLWPSGRSLHTACSVFNPSDEESSGDPHLLVIWGKGRDSKHCNDVWMLNTVTMKWEEVSLNQRPRMWHMSTSCYVDGKAEILIFGGNIRRSSKYERHAVTDLIILTFGVPSLREFCRLAITKYGLEQLPVFKKLPHHTQDKITNFQYIQPQYCQ